MNEKKTGFGSSTAGKLGGAARAKSLSKSQRSEIARKAAETRWGPLPVVTHGNDDHPLRIGDIEISCYVLDNGTRVISHRGLQRSLGMAESGGARGMVSVLERLGEKGLDLKGLPARISNPIEFRPPRGRSAFGYEATVLADLCDLLLAARKEGILSRAQQFHADRAEILVRGFMRVGIIALVDEATGYQDDRDRRALAKILEAFIDKELRAWVKTFPVEYYKEMYRLRGLPYPPQKGNKMPQYFGVLTNDVVYSRLAPSVLDELKKKNPTDESGRRSTKHHQWLTRDVGHPKLLQHLGGVITVMKLSDTWDDFKKTLDRTHPKQISAPLFEGANDGDKAVPPPPPPQTPPSKES